MVGWLVGRSVGRSLACSLARLLACLLAGLLGGLVFVDWLVGRTRPPDLVEPFMEDAPSDLHCGAAAREVC